MSNITQQPIYQKGKKPGVSPIVRKASRDATCKLQVPGVCNHDNSTVVGAHIRLFSVAGAGQKPDDVLMIDACSNCHALFDSRDKWADAGLGWDDVMQGLMRTLLAKRAAGLIILKGEK